VTIASFLSSHANGADQTARVLVWERMLHQSLMLLSQAQQRVCSPSLQKELQELDGWWRTARTKLRGKTCRVPSEEAITEALCVEMEKIRKELIVQGLRGNRRLAGLDSLAVAPDQPRNMKTGIGKKSKPTDIRFYRLNSEALDLRVEAKVLIREGDLKASYLSKKGLQRFSDVREPYTDNEIGGMVAYAVTDSQDEWTARIEHALQSSAPPYPTFKYQLDSLPTDTLFSRVPYTVRASIRNEVLVFHFVLEFVCEPDVRQSTCA